MVGSFQYLAMFISVAQNPPAQKLRSLSSPLVL